MVSRFPQVWPLSVEVMDTMEKKPLVSLSKTAMIVLPLMVATPVMPSRDVMPAPEIVCALVQVAPLSVENL